MIYKEEDIPAEVYQAWAMQLCWIHCKIGFGKKLIDEYDETVRIYPEFFKKEK